MPRQPTKGIKNRKDKHSHMIKLKGEEARVKSGAVEATVHQVMLVTQVRTDNKKGEDPNTDPNLKADHNPSLEHATGVVKLIMTNQIVGSKKRTVLTVERLATLPQSAANHRDQ
jgi:hypothetical protein